MPGQLDFLPNPTPKNGLTPAMDLFLPINYIIIHINKFFSIQPEKLDRSNKMTIVPNNWMNAIKKPADGRHYFGGFFVDFCSL